MIIKENEVEQFDFDGLKIADYAARKTEKLFKGKL